MSEIWPGGDHQYSNNLGLSLWGADPVVIENFLTIDTAFVALTTNIDINGVAVPNPNFVNSASVTFSVVGSNVHATAAGGGSGAWATLTGDLTETQVIPFDGVTVGVPDTGISRIADGILAIGNGTQGNYTGGLKLTSLTFADGTHQSTWTKYVVSSYGMVGDGSTDNTTAMTTLLAAISTNVATIVFPQGTFKLGNITFPANVTLDFTAGGAITVITGNTVTIKGAIIAPPRTVFYNAVSGQGTISFVGNTLIQDFYVDWWQTYHNNGANSDLPAMQACSDAASQGGNSGGGYHSGGTIVLLRGRYDLGSGTWTVSLAGSGSAQQYLNIRGAGINSTMLYSSITGSTAALYIAEIIGGKFSDFSITGPTAFSGNLSSPAATGIGIGLGGSGSGTQTHDIIFEHVSVAQFSTGIATSYGTGSGVTSSECTFINCSLVSCTKGFNNSNYNGLDFNFIQLEMANNGYGIYMGTASCYVYGGSASGNLTDFYFTSGATNVVIGFRSENSGCLVNNVSGITSLIGCNFESLSNYPSQGNGIIANGGSLTAEACIIMGSIVLSNGSLSLRNNQIYDVGNTYVGIPTSMQGPGFITPAISGPNGSTWEAFGNSNTASPYQVWPDGEGMLATLPSGCLGAISTTGGVGLQQTISSNTIKPTGVVSHVTGSNGTINTISLLDNNGGSNLYLYNITLIADSPFTLITGGNIAASVKVQTNGVVSLYYDIGTNLWYPSAVSGPYWASLTGDLTETQVIPWDGGTPGTPTTGISRTADGTLAIGNGTQGNASGQLGVAVVRNTGFTVANLPATAGAGKVEGATAYATNGLKPTELTGNGTGVPVFYSAAGPAGAGWYSYPGLALVAS